MNDDFDIDNFKNLPNVDTEYGKQLTRLKGKGFNTNVIECAVSTASKNLKKIDPSPFIIYGEPQSGKTEMMICLSAKLVDEQFKIIILLLNDSVDLLSQNLGRFQESALAPSPKNFTEVLDPEYNLGNTAHVVFCKKNAKDLQKLIDKIDSLGQVVIIDDEADYATPNSKINQDLKTRINELIEKLLGYDGLYIGVTATPARLDLNNTFGNKTAQWVDFPVHDSYAGQDVFFPMSGRLDYSLKLLPDTGDYPEHTKTAFFSYLVASACLNYNKKNSECVNYSMLVHTSGKTADHEKDKKVIQGIMQSLSDKDNKKFEPYVEDIWNVAKKRYQNKYAIELTQFILKNISRSKVIVLNSKRDVTVNGEDASNPKSLFTVVIGGNIVSRGVTFNNLLSMYFARDVKTKIQQDTYIQRARMFGVRGEYLRHFELTIPKSLYNDWHRCFAYHKLSLDGARAGNAPMWIADRRVSVAAGSSIDKTNIYQTKSSEMSFKLFEFPDNIREEIQQIANSDQGVLLSTENLNNIADSLGEGGFPSHLKDFIRHFGSENSKVALYPSSNIESMKEDKDRGDDFDDIFRSRGFWGQFARDKLKTAIHHLRIFYNRKGNAKLFYRYDCDDVNSLIFLWNQRNQ